MTARARPGLRVFRYSVSAYGCRPDRAAHDGAVHTRIVVNPALSWLSLQHQNRQVTNRCRACFSHHSGYGRKPGRSVSVISRPILGGAPR